MPAALPWLLYLREISQASEVPEFLRSFEVCVCVWVEGVGRDSGGAIG